jgi:four helix bundle protein
LERPVSAPYFDHEKLHVYQETIAFVAWVQPIIERVPRGESVRDQPDRASTSMPLNIAEGNGRFTAPDRCRFFDIARASSLESASCLDVLHARKRLEPGELDEGKARLRRIVAMLVGLIRNNSDRVYDSASEQYVVDRTEA